MLRRMLNLRGFNERFFEKIFVFDLKSNLKIYRLTKPRGFIPSTSVRKHFFHYIKELSDFLLYFKHTRFLSNMRNVSYHVTLGKKVISYTVSLTLSAAAEKSVLQFYNI